MSAVLKMFAADELRPARTTDRPSNGDQVEFWLADGSAGAVGRVGQVKPDGWLMVDLDGIGSFLVAPGRATVLARAH